MTALARAISVWVATASATSASVPASAAAAPRAFARATEGRRFAEPALEAL